MCSGHCWFLFLFSLLADSLAGHHSARALLAPEEKKSAHASAHHLEVCTERLCAAGPPLGGKGAGAPAWTSLCELAPVGSGFGGRSEEDECAMEMPLRQPMQGCSGVLRQVWFQLAAILLWHGQHPSLPPGGMVADKIAEVASRTRGRKGQGQGGAPLLATATRQGQGWPAGWQPQAAVPSGRTGKGETFAPSQLMQQLPAAPTAPRPALPTGAASSDGTDKVPQKLLDIMAALSASKEALPAEVRSMLDEHMESDRQLATKQLHKLVAQQSKAHKELGALRKARSQFVREWTSYLESLTQLLEKQMGQKSEAMASMAEAEESWQVQLGEATRAIRQQTAPDTLTIEDSDEDAMDAEIDMDAAAEASRQKAVEHSQQQEQGLLSALQSAVKASDAQAQQYRERTPRRQRGSAPEVKKEEPGEKPGTQPDDKQAAKGGAKQPPPGGAQ